MMKALLDALCFVGLIAAQFSGVIYVARQRGQNRWPGRRTSFDG